MAKKLSAGLQMAAQLIQNLTPTEKNQLVIELAQNMNEREQERLIKSLGPLQSACERLGHQFKPMKVVPANVIRGLFTGRYAEEHHVYCTRCGKKEVHTD